MQLYVIRARVNGMIVTAALCLLQRKSKHTYEELFQTIVEECAARNLDPDPKYVHMDFEISAMEALTEVFGSDIKIRGCFYHLCQSTYRKIQELGLATRYQNEEDFRHICGMIDALAFLPRKDVKAGMAYLQSIVPVEAQDLLQYFDYTYVNGPVTARNTTRHGALRLRRRKPLFPPKVWNINSATLKGKDKTNNSTEGWNNRFSHLVGNNHPDIWTLIVKMRQEIAADQTKLEQLMTGKVAKKTKLSKYENLNNRLKTLCEQYKNSTSSTKIAVLLNGISSNIRFI